MSNFTKKVKNPRTGLEQIAVFIDKGHDYEVIFNLDGSDYDFSQSEKRKTESFKEKEIK